MTNESLFKRIDYIMSKADEALSTQKRNQYGGIEINPAEMRGFKTAGLSFILDLFGDSHPYYTTFKEVTRHYYDSNVKSGIQILENIKAEIENGWLTSIKNIVSAEIFSDFLNMAQHLLENDYKDAAAVMIGSVLEEHLRQLCLKNGIEISYKKDEKVIPLKSDRLNSELAKAGVYSKLDQKNVTANLDLRNKAAHGHYTEYDIEQVKLMLHAVLNFLTRHQL